MGQLDKMANALFGGKRAETQDGFAQDKTATIIGTAVTDSDSGAVMVELSSDVTNPEPVEIDGETYFEDASTAVELPTTQAVQAGDEVLVSVYGGTALKNSVVTGVVGSGDRLAADAEAAREIAEATGQHFWDDDSGAHVTELARPDWEQQQTGPNSLWNSLGMLFRDGLNNLLALLPNRQASESFIVQDTHQTMYVELSNPVQSIVSVSVNGSEVDPSKYGLSGPSEVWIHWSVLEDDAEVIVTYRTASSIVLYDGAGNTADHESASFSGNVVKMANGFFKFEGETTLGFENSGRISIAEDELQNAEIRLTRDNITDSAYTAIEVRNTDKSAVLIVDSGRAGAYGEDGARKLDLTYLDGTVIDGAFFWHRDIKPALQKAIRLGTTYSASKNVSIAANTDVMGASVNVPAGTYLVICWQTFLNPGSSGQRTTTIGTYSGGSLASYTTAVQATRDQVRVQHMNIVTTTGSSTTLQAYARSNIAASGNNNSQINAVCIG